MHSVNSNFKPGQTPGGDPNEKPLEGEDEENVKFLQELVKADAGLTEDDDSEQITPQQIRDLYLRNGKDFEKCYEYIIKFNEELESVWIKEFEQDIKLSQEQGLSPRGDH